MKDLVTVSKSILYELGSDEVSQPLMLSELEALETLFMNNPILVMGNAYRLGFIRGMNMADKEN